MVNLSAQACTVVGTGKEGTKKSRLCAQGHPASGSKHTGPVDRPPLFPASRLRTARAPHQSAVRTRVPLPATGTEAEERKLSQVLALS